MLISISHIGHDLVNPRRIKTPPESDAALLRSIQTLGLLQPVLVVRNGAEGHWNLLAGRRRLAAVAALGLTEITAEDVTDRIDPDEDTGLAIGAAENMVRAPMHPVDQWRAISDLSASSGYSIETAAAALGVNAALARRMAHLGKMAPDLLDAIGAGDLPEVRYLRIIAAAPHAMQIAALEQGRSEDRVYWSRVAEAC